MTRPDEAAARVARFLATYASMEHLHAEEIHSVGSAASNHETVVLRVSDLKALLSAVAPTPAEPRPQTDDEAYVYAARREYETVALKLEQVAEHIRERGQYVGTGRSTAVSQAAETMSEFTNGVGNIGTFLWGVVHNAEHLDRFRREAAAKADPGESSAIADELEQLAYEMDERPAGMTVTGEDVRARASQLRGWCNCQAIEGTSNYPGPWHPKGDPVGCLKSGASDSSAVTR